MSHELDIRIRYCFLKTTALDSFIILFLFKQIVLLRLLRLARFCWSDFALSHVNLKTYYCCSLIEISRNVVNTAQWPRLLGPQRICFPVYICTRATGRTGKRKAVVT